MSGLLVILSSPSGTGKTTIARRLLQARPDIAFSVSATTRARRQKERDGVDYHFLSREQFLQRRDQGAFLEWAEYSGNLYGTLLEEVEGTLAEGRHVLLDIEVQGAQQVKARRGDAVAIFVLPPSADELIRRLTGRASEGAAELARRLVQARWELEQAMAYEYVIVNDDLAAAVAAVSGIVDAEARRTARQGQVSERIEALRRELAAYADRLAQSETTKEP